MKHLAIALTLTLAASSGAMAAGQKMSKADQIDEAVSALPQAMRAGATVISYSSTGTPVVLRQGNGDVICNPNEAGGKGFRVVCYGKPLKAQNDMQAKLRAEGKDAKAIQAAVQEARDSGKLSTPPLGTTIYIKSGKSENDAHEMWVVLMPNVKGEDLGLPTKRMNTSSPWMMRSGTPNAHIMMPQTASMSEAPPPARRM